MFSKVKFSKALWYLHTSDQSTPILLHIMENESKQVSVTALTAAVSNQNNFFGSRSFAFSMIS